MCDIVYVPLMTKLLEQAQARGNQTVTGIGMLLHRARPAFEKWFGVLPDVTEELEKRFSHDRFRFDGFHRHGEIKGGVDDENSGRARS